jgi:hypothetical protein
MARDSESVDQEREALYLGALDAFGLPRLSESADRLRSATSDRRPFDIAGWELIARAGMVGQMVVGATSQLPDGSRRGLTLDEAVNGGLLVRLTKLLRALFDSTQTEDSEAHQILARCAGETAINLRWLLRFGQPEHYKRFRADAFVVLLRTADKVDPDHEDPVARGAGELVSEIVSRELRDAGLDREDVPRRTGQWGGTLRQRFEALDESGLYDAFFATHSDYVHGSWHELRAFHLRSVKSGYALDLTYGGLTPSAMYETARLVLRAVDDYIDQMPVGELDLESLHLVTQGTIDATTFASLEFARFVADGGIDDQVNRHLPTESISAQRQAAEEAVRRRVEYQAGQSGGRVEVMRHRDDAPAWAEELIRQFAEARPTMRVCPHLAEEPTQPSIWLAALPDLLACQGRECEGSLGPTLEAQLGHCLAEEPAHCSVCGREALVQGVSVGVGTTMIRGMVCEECKSGSVNPTPKNPPPS